MRKASSLQKPLVSELVVISIGGERLRELDRQLIGELPRKLQPILGAVAQDTAQFLDAVANDSGADLAIVDQRQILRQVVSGIGRLFGPRVWVAT